MSYMFKQKQSIYESLSNGCVNIKVCLSDAVAFHAHTFADNNPQPGDNIKFKTELFNVGNGYNLDTGAFTAPVSGVYIFTAHLCVQKGLNLDYIFVKDEETIITGDMYENDGYTCATASAVILLQKNEKMAIRCRSNACGGYIKETTTDRNTLSGALINIIH